MSQPSPAGWHPDPFGRYEYRYWDGTRWTDHVATQGRQGNDPPVERESVQTPFPVQMAAGWHADPARRYELRYWDGARWSEHVATRGVAGTDPLVQTSAAPPVQAVDPHTPALPVVSMPLTPATKGRPNRRVARQARKAGVSDIEAGGGTLFTERVLVVNQKAKLLGSTLGYSIYDQRGQRLGTVTEVRRDLMTKVRDRYRNRTDRTRAYRFQIVDLQDRLLLAMNRPETGFWGPTPIVIEGPGGSPIGEIVRESTGVANAAATAARGVKDMLRGESFGNISARVKSAAEEINIMGGSRFRLESQGVLLARIHSANHKEWNFSVRDPSENEIGAITKTWAGWTKERFSKADNYVVKMDDPLDEPLRSLVIASAVAIDFELKQGEHTRGSSLWGTRTYK